MCVCVEEPSSFFKKHKLTRREEGGGGGLFPGSGFVIHTGTTKVQ